MISGFIRSKNCIVYISVYSYKGVKTIGDHVIRFKPINSHKFINVVYNKNYSFLKWAWAVI